MDTFTDQEKAERIARAMVWEQYDGGLPSGEGVLEKLVASYLPLARAALRTMKAFDAPPSKAGA